MTRAVRQITPAQGGPEEAGPRAFSEFAGHANLVLLGDPGAGKTHLFRQVAAAEHGQFIKARAFLVTPADRLSGTTLFIDGLDERRAGRGDRDTIDAIVEKLFKVSPAKVRISCRASDWLGESDLYALNPYFDQNGNTAVLLLQSLSPDEQLSVLATQGVGADAVGEFLAGARERGLDDFLENPQNLIMLWRAVQTGSWPATRQELFELSTGLMLQEADTDRARSGSGIYSVAELRSVAGAVCAVRLISDVEAISLTDQEGTPEIPGYRSLTFLEPEKTQAALGRRVFVADSEPESVDYAHRTTAEYLAAACLAQRVCEGLPLGRVSALIGIDGHPAPELRGLHAWLAVHLPEYADQLIEADPYGVLTYGDAASLSPSSCACLIRALGALSRTDPWFRSKNMHSRSIGALARPDMVSELRTVLRDPDAGFGVRSIVLDALSLGPPLREMVTDLAGIFADDAAPYAERSTALLALLRFGDDGTAPVINAFRVGLGKSANGLRLRSVVIQRLYGQPFGSAEVIALINDALETDDAVVTGMFWSLPDYVAIQDVPDILDGINTPRTSGHDRRSWEIGSIYARLLARAWCSPGAFDAGRALHWLRKRIALRPGRDASSARDLRLAMKEAPERIQAVADHFFRTLVVDARSRLKFWQFREAILFELSADALLSIIIAHLEAAEDNTEIQTFLYEEAINLSYQTTRPNAEVVFERLFALADSKAHLTQARDRLVTLPLPEDFFEGWLQHTSESEEGREKQRLDFKHNEDQIRKGTHLGWITHLGRIYFALYVDIERELSPRKRLAAWLGNSKVDAATAGLRAALSRSDIPTFEDVLGLTAGGLHHDWWYALVAGMTERWAVEEGFDQLSDDFLKALVAFDLANPVFSLQDGAERILVHPWKDALINRRPELVRDAYIAVVRTKLIENGLHADGLDELLTQVPFELYRKDITLQLLREFPNANPINLGKLLGAIGKFPSAHEEFLLIADKVLSGAANVDERQRDMWLASAYLISAPRYEAEVEIRGRARPEFVFDLRDRSGFALRGQPQTGPLPLSMLEFMLRLTGTVYPATPLPINGRSGDRNPWDAAQHCHNLIDLISTIPSEAATNALVRLEANSELDSYRPHIRHALANQRQRRRDAEYDRPNWPQTVRALENGAPATVGDLHALLVDHLRGLKKRIERANTDIYRQFWNVDSYGRPTSPRPEELCRDYLVELLRPVLLPRDITVEPEAHMLADKRADISVAMPGRKTLCELKRDYHADVWTAAAQQLERFYAHDPEAKGFGVYCVFWFGDKRPNNVPMPPNGLSRPQSAAEMERMLKDLLPNTAKSRIAIIVVDVSGG